MFYTSYISKLRNEFLSLYEAQKYPQACKLGDKIIDIYKDNKAPESLRYAQDLYNTACSYQKDLKFKTAMSLYDDAKNMIEYLIPDNQPYPECLGDIYTNIAIIYNLSGKSDMALSCFEKAYTIYMQDVCTIQSTSKANYNMGSIYFDMKDYNEALFYYKAALNLVDKNSTLYYDILNSIGYCYEKLKDYNQAQKLLEQALEVIKQIHKINSKEYLVNINYLCTMLLSSKKYDDAIEWLKKTSAIAKALFNEGHPVYAEILSKLGDAYNSKKDYATAIMYKKKATEIAIRLNNTLNHTALLLQLSQLYKKIKELDKAALTLKQYLDLKKELVGDNSISFIKDTIDLADIYISDNNSNAAIQTLEPLLDNPKLTPLLCNNISQRLIPLYEQMGYGKQLYLLYDKYVTFFPGKSFDDMLNISKE